MRPSRLLLAAHPTPPALVLASAVGLVLGGCWSGGGIGTSFGSTQGTSGNGLSPASGQAGALSPTSETAPTGTVSSAGTGSSTPSSTSTSTSTSTTTTPPSGQTPTTPPASHLPPLPNPIPGLTVIGRADLSDPAGARFALCNSRIGVRFNGPTLTVRLKGTGQDRWGVTVDGKDANPPFIVTVPGQATTYTLAEKLAEGTHTVWMAKMTEFSQGSGTDAGVTQFLGFGFPDGGGPTTPPEPRLRRLDFIGDSGFTGYGAGQLVTLDQNPTTGQDCGYSPMTQNALTSVPQYTADLLSAELMNMSWSGKAIAHSIYDGDPAHMLPVVYNEILPPAAAPAWDFTQWTADAVIINGGGNDVFNAYQPGQEYFYDPSLFTSNYLSWLKRIRQVYPKAWVVVMLTHAASGSNAQFLGDALKNVVAQANAGGDARVVYFGYFENDPTYHSYDEVARALQFYWGCNKHPSPAGAQFLAKRLADFLAAKLAAD